MKDKIAKIQANQPDPCILKNVCPAKLYEEALIFEDGAAIANTGALIVYSGERTGRSPKDKRIVREPTSEQNIWWGPINIELTEKSFSTNRERAIDYLNTRKRLYVVDGFAGWDPTYRIKVRVIATRPYHALFMHNMLIRPTEQQLKSFGNPDFTIYNAGVFPCNSHTPGMTSKTSVAFNFRDGEIVILGTEYAGEMKKGIFTVMNYIMPKKNILSMHCSANQDDKGNLSLFFGLSGTGKTTLSAVADRLLIGDDEHCWSDDGIFNIEGGCYAKCIDLSEAKEPEIWRAIRSGTILENVDFDDETRVIDFSSSKYTENTRASYPIEHIVNSKVPCVGPHPNHIIFLTCDAFGVLPPVAKLSPEQAMYHFISGYTAKVAGTEMGVTEPEATFSACFGAAFMVWHPSKYAKLLAEKIKKHKAKVWLVNTGWTKGPYGVGKRMELKHTRAIINAIHNGSIDKTPSITDDIFGLQIPKSCPDVPTEILNPQTAWPSPTEYNKKAMELAILFKENFKKFESGSPAEIMQAGPRSNIS